MSLTVEGIGGDKRVGQVLLPFDHGLGGLQLTVGSLAFLLAGLTHGVWHSGVVFGHADQTDGIADELPVQSQRDRQCAAVLSQPLAQVFRKAVDVKFREQVVKHLVFRRFSIRAAAKTGQAERHALVSVESVGKTHDGRDTAMAAEDRHRHDGQHRADMKAPVGGPRVRDLAEDGVQRFELL